MSLGGFSWERSIEDNLVANENYSHSAESWCQGDEPEGHGDGLDPKVVELMGTMPADYPASWSWWTAPGRLIVFTLAATSIGCLLAEFYGLCSMRTFTFFILIPALVILAVMTGADCQRGDGRLGRGVLIGAAAGLIRVS